MSTEKRFLQIVFLILFGAMTAYTLLLRSAFYNEDGFPRTGQVVLRIIGEDAAGDYALFRLLEGRHPQAYDAAVQTDYVHQKIEAAGNFESFAFPVKAFIAVPFLHLSYPAYFDTLFFWGFFLFGAALYALFPLRVSALLLMALPAAFVNFAFGGFGLFVAAAVVFALMLADEYPYRAAFFAGLLAAEPLVFLLAVLAFAFRKQKKALIGTLIFAAFLVVMTGVRYGFGSYVYSFTAGKQALADYPCRFVSFAGAALCTGVPAVLAALMQAIVSTLVVFQGYVLFFRRPLVSRAVQNAFLCVAAVLLSPVAALGDFALLSAAVAFLLYDSERRGYLKADVVVFTAVFLAIFLDGILAAKIGVSVQLLIAAAVSGVCWRRAV